MNWIKARLNKDNFWNLMFSLGTVSSILLTEILVHTVKIGLVGLALFILSATMIPYLISSFNEVAYLGNKVFLTNKGRNLSDNLPVRFHTIFLINFAFSVFIYIPYILLTNSGINGFPFATTAGLILALPTLYFICINCPISILFNKHSWQLKINGFPLNNKFIFSTSSCSNPFGKYKPSSSPNYSNDNAYRHLSCNGRYNR